MKARPAPRGFTLVELLIVVIVLGILAAVALPQLSTPTPESKEAAIAGNLARIRQAIELYKLHHNDTFPTSEIADQLTNTTDVTGDTTGTGYGPYLRTFPRNPLLLDGSVKVVTTMPASADNSTGWIFATGNGEFRANSSGAGPSGKDYFDL